MTTERERIEKLLADGKVSAEEAERLRAALDRAEREDVQAHPRPGDEIAQPRLSRLALAGAVMLPVALGLFVTAFGFGVALGTSYERAAAGGAVAAAASLVTALILGASALIAIRRVPGELRGRGLAWLGIIAPLLVTTAAMVAVPRVIEFRKHVSAEAEARALGAAFADLAHLQSDAAPHASAEWHEGLAIIARVMESLDPIAFRRHRAVGKGMLDALDRCDFEAAMKISFSMPFLAKQIESRYPDSIMGDKAFEFGKGKLLAFTGATFAPDLMTGELVLTVAGDEAKGIVLPVVNREGKWYFSAEPVRFLGGEPEASPTKATDSVEPERTAQ